MEKRPWHLFGCRGLFISECAGEDRLRLQTEDFAVVFGQYLVLEDYYEKNMDWDRCRSAGPGFAGSGNDLSVSKLCAPIPGLG
jgi:hypothetical protein